MTENPRRSQVAYMKELKHLRDVWRQRNAEATFKNLAPLAMARLMRKYPWNTVQTAGAVGNLGHESEGFTAYDEADGIGHGVGWAQWTGRRRRAFERYAKDHDLDPRDQKTSLSYLEHDLDTDYRYVAKALSNARDLNSATSTWMEKYEIPGIPHLEGRQNYARKALALYKNFEINAWPWLNALQSLNSDDFGGVIPNGWLRDRYPGVKYIPSNTQSAVAYFQSVAWDGHPPDPYNEGDIYAGTQPQGGTQGISLGDPRYMRGILTLPDPFMAPAAKMREGALDPALGNPILPYSLSDLSESWRGLVNGWTALRDKTEGSGITNRFFPSYVSPFGAIDLSWIDRLAPEAFSGLDGSWSDPAAGVAKAALDPIRADSNSHTFADLFRPSDGVSRAAKLAFPFSIGRRVQDGLDPLRGVLKMSRQVAGVEGRNQDEPAPQSGVGTAYAIPRFMSDWRPGGGGKWAGHFDFNGSFAGDQAAPVLPMHIGTAQMPAFMPSMVGAPQFPASVVSPLAKAVATPPPRNTRTRGDAQAQITHHNVVNVQLDGKLIAQHMWRHVESIFNDAFGAGNGFGDGHFNDQSDYRPGGGLGHQ